MTLTDREHRELKGLSMHLDRLIDEILTVGQRICEAGASWAEIAAALGTNEQAMRDLRSNRSKS